jgi:hypothetical protein
MAFGSGKGAGENVCRNSASGTRTTVKLRICHAPALTTSKRDRELRYAAIAGKNHKRFGGVISTNEGF